MALMIWIISSHCATNATARCTRPAKMRELRQLLMPMESRVPVNWRARFGKQHRGNTGQAVRPYADFTQPF